MEIAAHCFPKVEPQDLQAAVVAASQHVALRHKRVRLYGLLLGEQQRANIMEIFERLVPEGQSAVSWRVRRRRGYPETVLVNSVGGRGASWTHDRTPRVVLLVRWAWQVLCKGMARELELEEEEVCAVVRSNKLLLMGHGPHPTEAGGDEDDGSPGQQQMVTGEGFLRIYLHLVQHDADLLGYWLDEQRRLEQEQEEKDRAAAKAMASTTMAAAAAVLGTSARPAAPTSPRAPPSMLLTMEGSPTGSLSATCRPPTTEPPRSPTEQQQPPQRPPPPHAPAKQQSPLSPHGGGPRARRSSIIEVLDQYRDPSHVHPMRALTLHHHHHKANKAGRPTDAHTTDQQQQQQQHRDAEDGLFVASQELGSTTQAMLASA